MTRTNPVLIGFLGGFLLGFFFFVCRFCLGYHKTIVLAEGTHPSGKGLKISTLHFNVKTEKFTNFLDQNT